MVGQQPSLYTIFLVCTHPYLRLPAPSILYPKSVIRVYDRIVFVPIRWVTSLVKA